MIDFSSLSAVESFPERLAQIQIMGAKYSVEDLRSATSASVDNLLAIIRDATDADALFVPQDAKAFDEHATDKAHANDGWTLGHVIVHQTASAEEAAFVAAELARGVEYHGRSRYETAWEGITTIAQCRQRLEESRRMRLASLEIWPDVPNLTNTCALFEGAPPNNATARFLLGLWHEHGHFDQLAEIMKQARAARA